MAPKGTLSCTPSLPCPDSLTLINLSAHDRMYGHDHTFWDVLSESSCLLHESRVGMREQLDLASAPAAREVFLTSPWQPGRPAMAVLQRGWMTSTTVKEIDSFR